MANPFEFPTEVADRAVRRRAVGHLKKAGVRLPTFEELAEPEKAPPAVRAGLAAVDPDAPHPANLYRVNWLNDMARTGQMSVPAFVELPETLTGVKARIVLALGALFPMIRAHKVLAAYGCLAPRLVSGRFDPTRRRAVWPSTGNYCRGGVAISRILGCRGVAVLPAGMSQERFDWLSGWVAAPEDVIRTPGTEFNVKEIYDECRGAGARSGQRDRQPVLRVRQLPGALALHRPGARADLRDPLAMPSRASGSPASSPPAARPARSAPATT